jgi:two-component system, response regulator YesN
MYTTLIVDDEQLMRKYLEHNLSKICPDFCVTGVACDGLEALELIEKQHFDLIITDIKMPEMDGLNLSKHIHDINIASKVVIISGYNEFEYARTALKYGVVDYLLKPLSESNIIETLKNIKEQLEHDALVQKEKSLSISDDTLGNQQLKNNLLSAIIDNNTSKIQIFYTMIKNIGVNFQNEYACIQLFQIDVLSLYLYNKSILNSSFRYELNRQCREYADSNNITSSYDNSGNVLFLLTSDSKDAIVLMANTIFKDITTNYWNNKEVKILSTYGFIVTDIMTLSLSYTSALEALTLQLKNEKSPISSNYFISQRDFIQTVQIICDSLYYDYVSKNYNKASSDILLYIQLFEDNINTASVLRYGNHLVKHISDKCNIKNEFIRAAFEELKKGIDQNITNNSLDKAHIHNLFLQILKSLNHEQSLEALPEATRLIENAKEFICTHYQEPISLLSIADNLNVNATYLSTLFHKVIGEPYSKYLTRIRMEQAALLLKSNPSEKIYIIAEKTGFVSPKHFNSVFKKFYGITPTEYLKTNLYS